MIGIKRTISFILVFALLIMPINLSAVNAKTKKMKISEKKIYLYVGDSFKLKIKNAKKKVKWSSSNKKVATVSKKGKVKAKKKGKATIKAKVGKKVFKCKVKVDKFTYTPPKKTVSKIEYIGNRNLENRYDEKRYRLYFSLYLEDGVTEVKAKGTAHIKFRNAKGNNVYDKSLSFNESNFAYWLSGGKNCLECSIYIPYDEVEKSASSNGYYSLAVTLGDGTSFGEWEMSTSYLPVLDPSEICRVTLPGMPKNVSEYGVLTGDVLTTATLSNVEAKVTKSTSSYKVELTFSGTKIYDSEGIGSYDACKFTVKLYKDGVLEKTTNALSPNVTMYKSFTCKTSFSYLTEGDYTIVVSDYRR